MSIEQTLAERGNRYGDFADHAKIAQAIQDDMRIGQGWARLDDVKRQALTVIADKIARILSGDPNYADNWHDIQGYAKLVEDRLPSAIPADFGQQHTIEPKPAPIYTGLRCYVCGQQGGHGGLQCPTMRPFASAMLDAAGRQFEPASLIDDESPRMQAIAQNGNDGAAYSEIDRLRAAEAFNADLPVLGAVPQREPCQPRHRCQTCAGGHSTHECGAGL